LINYYSFLEVLTIQAACSFCLFFSGVFLRRLLGRHWNNKIILWC
jgi:hypothetical protein